MRLRTERGLAMVAEIDVEEGLEGEEEEETEETETVEDTGTT